MRLWTTVAEGSDEGAVSSVLVFAFHCFPSIPPRLIQSLHDVCPIRSGAWADLLQNLTQIQV